MLAIGAISQEKYMERKAAEELRIQRKHKPKQERVSLEMLSKDSDAHFFFIAGYTLGGAPYGVTWEEAEESGLVEIKSDTNLPFEF